MLSVHAEVGLDGIRVVQIKGDIGSPACAQELAQLVFSLDRRPYAAAIGQVVLDLAEVTLDKQGVLVLVDVWCELLTKRYDLKIRNLDPAYASLFEGPGIAPLLL